MHLMGTEGTGRVPRANLNLDYRVEIFILQENMNRLVVRWLVALLVLTISSCESASHDHEMRFRGHWISGIAYSYFVPLDGSRSYWMASEGLPPEMLKYMEAQPHHSYPYAGAGPCGVIYADIIGTVKRDPHPQPFMENLHVLYLKRALKWGPPKSGFLKTPAAHLPPF